MPDRGSPFHDLWFHVRLTSLHGCLYIYLPGDGDTKLWPWVLALFCQPPSLNAPKAALTGESLKGTWLCRSFPSRAELFESKGEKIKRLFLLHYIHWLQLKKQAEWRVLWTDSIPCSYWIKWVCVGGEGGIKICEGDSKRETRGRPAFNLTSMSSMSCGLRDNFYVDGQLYLPNVNLASVEQKHGSSQMMFNRNVNIKISKAGLSKCFLWTYIWIHLFVS